MKVKVSDTQINSSGNQVVSIKAISRMKNRFKAKISGTALMVSAAVGVFSISNASATGFPVVDIASLTESITIYMQQLESYATQLEQQSTQESQLISMINQYQQMLTDYDHYLTMVRGLDHYFDTRNVKRLLRTAKTDPHMNPFGDQFDPTIYTSTGAVNVNNELKRFYKRSRQLTNMNSDIDNFGGGQAFKDEAQQGYEQSQLATMQSLSVKNMDDEINNNVSARDELSDTVQAVMDAPESQVATLQTLAMQQQAIQTNLVTISKISNQQLSYSNQLPARLNGSMVRSQDAQIKRLRYLAENPPAPNARGFESF